MDYYTYILNVFGQGKSLAFFIAKIHSLFS